MIRSRLRTRSGGGGAAGTPAAPVNTVAPALSGDFFVGQVLTCSTGTWSGSPAPTYTYQWRNAGVDIGGETANTYTLVAGDDGDSIDCVVTATNASGSASQASNALIAIQATLWLDASDTATITQVSGSVSQWNDKSTNAYHATQGSGAAQPLTNTNTMNGLNVINFNSKNLVLPSGLYSFANSERTAFIVAKSVGTPTTSWLIGGGATDNQFGFLYRNNSADIQASGPSQIFADFLSLGGATSPHIMGFRVTAAGSRLKFTEAATQTVAGETNTTLTAPLNIGRARNGGEAANADIAEILFYQRSLTTDELNDIGAYLGTKWGITWTNI